MFRFIGICILLLVMVGGYIVVNQDQTSPSVPQPVGNDAYKNFKM